MDPDVLNVREYSLRSVGEAGGANVRQRGPFEKKFWVNVCHKRVVCKQEKDPNTNSPERELN